MFTCFDCGKEVSQNELHSHIPDIFLNVRDMRHSLARAVSFTDGTTKIEKLPFTVPEHWIEWILDDCSGGDIGTSGMYRLPGRVYEWCMSKLRHDEKNAAFIASGIDKLVKNYNNYE